MPLPEAIKKYVRPGMTLHFGVSHCRPNGISDEIVRQFWGQNPGFTLAMLGVVGNPTVLVYKRMVKKVISTFAEILILPLDQIECFKRRIVMGGLSSSTGAYSLTHYG